MNQPFPFGFPAPTATYLTLYVTTLALHVFFMSYVLAGSCYLGVSALFGKLRGDPEPGTVSDTLRDWLPFAVGLTITAGVAPLLFLQVLYEHRFYTANLLLFHRWMLIVPALIVGFYLLYLLKSGTGRQRPMVRRVAAVGSFLCFAFVAWSWTENHLLSADRAAWLPTYASGHLVYRSAETLPRLLMWFCGALPVMALTVAWQLEWSQRHGAPPPDGGARSEHNKLAHIALLGLSLGLLAAIGYSAVARIDVRSVVMSPLCLPYTVATALGGILQLGGWLMVRRRGMERRALTLASVGTIMSLVASGIMRESVRISAVDMTSLFPQHARAATSGGAGFFVLFLVVNSFIIAFAVRLGAKAARTELPS